MRISTESEDEILSHLKEMPPAGLAVIVVILLLFTEQKRYQPAVAKSGMMLTAEPPLDTAVIFTSVLSEMYWASTVP